jgi:ribosome maturation protein Sdo1
MSRVDSCGERRPVVKMILKKGMLQLAENYVQPTTDKKNNHLVRWRHVFKENTPRI